MKNARYINQRIITFAKMKLATLLGKKFPGRFETKLHNPLFIIGCGRSGTTMLTSLLRNHKDICSFSEANEIWDPEGYRWFNKNLNRPPIWYDPIKYTEVWRDYFNGNYRKQLKNIFGCYQFISRKKIFLNKSPMNTFRISDIFEIFPDARFIHIIRDGRAVAFSWAVKEYATIQKHADVYRKRGFFYTFNELIKYTALSWVKNLEEVEKQKRTWKLDDKDIFLEFKYEDFCDKPNEYIDLVCNFLSINRRRLGLDDLSHIKSMNYKWKENLDKNTIDKLNQITIPVLKKLYSEIS